MKSPEFLLIRFAPGSAGRFLAVLLMGSKDVAHFDPDVKTLDDKMDYVTKTFTKNLGSWLLTEPSDKIAWNITFVSNKYPRGDDLSIDQFAKLADENCTDWYHTNVNAKKKITIPWHKTSIPIFYRGQSITIILDKPSRKWFNRAHWIKHFGMHEGRIHLKENDPAVHRKPLDAVVARYNNPIYIDESFFSFVKNKVIRSKDVLPFYDYSSLDKLTNDLPINLSNLLDKKSCIRTINQLCVDLDISPIDQHYIEFSYDHWRNLHPF